MRSKINEPLSNLGKRIVRVVEKGVFETLAAPGTKTIRTASSVTLVEEITPIRKKPRMADKGKKKTDSRSFSIWDDIGLAMARAYEVVTAEELKIFSGMPSNEVVGRHVHKLVQVMYLCNFILFFLFLLHHPKNFSLLFRC